MMDIYTENIGRKKEEPQATVATKRAKKFAKKNSNASKNTTRKCYNCRKEIKGKKLFCKDCEKKERPKHETLIIYHSV